MIKQLVHNMPGAAATARKRSTRLLVVLLCVIFAVTAAGCGGHNAEAPSQDDTVLTVRNDAEESFSEQIRIGVSEDTPDVTPLLESLPDKYTVESYDSEKDLREAFAEGRVHMAVLTPGGAAKTSKNDKSARMISPVYLGGYRLVGNKNYLKIQDPYRPQPAGTSANTTDTAAGTTDTAAPETAGTTGTAQQDVSKDTVVTVPHDPVAAGEINKDNILPSQLRSGRINVWHDTDTLIDLAVTLSYMDGMTEAPTVIRRYEEETPRDYLTEYNHYALTNIRTPYGGQKAFTDLSRLLDVDAYWEAMVGTPLPSAVLLAGGDMLERAEEEELDAAAILSRDFGAALESLEKKKAGGIVFYGGSNRGSMIMKNYYEQVYRVTDQASYIPGEAFYFVK